MGIVSFGVGCDSRINGVWQFFLKLKINVVTFLGKKLSGVYARVTEALDWITESIADGQCYA